MARINLLGVNFDNVTREEALSALEIFLDSSEPNLICTPNTEAVVLAQKDARFRKILNNDSKLNLVDGIGIQWAAKFLALDAPQTVWLRQPIIFLQWLSTIAMMPFFPRYFSLPITERLPGADFIWQIARLAAKRKNRIFLLGGAPTVAERCALRLQTDVYDLRIVGVHSGTPDETGEILAAINHSRADILLVAFGMPKQEKWLAENLAKTKCRIGIGLGGTFDFIAGTQRRAPQTVRNAGLEWFYRLVQEPGRIKRQLALPKFIWLVLIEKIKERRVKV